MTKVLINNFEYIIKMRVRIIVAMCAIAACFLAGYGFFMEKTIVNTVTLTAMQSTLAHENQTVSNLSGQYVALSRNITLASALALGFKEAPIVAFISVPAPSPKSPALSINAI
jgi:hypothetical protein